MREIDLHVHTTASDGTFTPTEAVKLAAETGLRAMAVTDHDNMRGCAEAARAGEAYGVEIVPGIEISTKFRQSVHILGYYVDPDAPAMRETLDWVVQDRDNRNKKMADLMSADGLPVSYEQMHERFGPVIGRPHFARILVEFGLAGSIAEAFDKYVEKGRRYYVPRSILSIERSVEIIRESDGVPVLAHPFQYHLDDAGLRELIEHCMDSGLMGIECRYSGYNENRVAYLQKLAGEYGLLTTGGSDFHGANKPHIALGRGIGGDLEVPYEYLQRLKEVRNSEFGIRN
ncbi:MAG: PHP domain-containing protein [Oscillospiraceae bacterium]|nr:PHP domain-containing protein [Oscillospiraceae bacterium]